VVISWLGDVTPSPPSSDLVVAYLQHLEVERRVAANTLDAYRRDLRRFEAFARSRERTIDGMGRGDLEGFVRDTMASGLSPTSTARLVATLRGFYRFLRIAGRIAQNPADDLHAPRAFVNLPRCLSLEEVDALLAAPDVSTPRGLRDRALIEVLYATGLRVSELVGLRLTDLRLEEGYLQCMGKGSKQRIVPLGDEAIGWVRRYQTSARPALARRRDSSWLFLNARDGARLSRLGF
jgi:integrase/recombinase XerD